MDRPYGAISQLYTAPVGAVHWAALSCIFDNPYPRAARWTAPTGIVHNFYRKNVELLIYNYPKKSFTFGNTYVIIKRLA